MLLHYEADEIDAQLVNKLNKILEEKAEEQRSEEDDLQAKKRN